jgi:protein TonB
MSAERTPVRLVWLSEPGPGGGGGGGGNHTLEPPRRVELPGRDARTVPAAKPPVVDSSTQAHDDPIQRLIIPVAPLASGTEALPGAVEAPSGMPTASQGPGQDGGAGGGRGSGDGSLRGPGLGDGWNGGIGGEIYRPAAT